MRRSSSVRICLAASGGGHVRQLLDLEPVWADADHFFVTEDTILGRHIAAKHETYFVDHVALGQARLGAPFRMICNAVRNCMGSLRIIARQRPDIIITTGAGSVFFTLLWGRMIGAHVILIDSFARFHRPSVFARIGGFFAHVRIAQAKESAENWRGSLLFDPLKISVTDRRPKKSPLLFATVGATLSFDRLIGLVSRAKASGLLPEQVIAQTGAGGEMPPGLECHESLPFDEVKDILRRADIVVCHGGTGSLITALREGCRVIAVPRRFERGEHYDNHQAEITDAFAKRGLIAVADTDEEFAAALIQARHREPKIASTDPTALITFLRDHISRRTRTDFKASVAPYR